MTGVDVPGCFVLASGGDLQTTSREREANAKIIQSKQEHVNPQWMDDILFGFDCHHYNKL